MKEQITGIPQKTEDEIHNDSFNIYLHTRTVLLHLTTLYSYDYKSILNYLGTNVA